MDLKTPKALLEKTRRLIITAITFTITQTTKIGKIRAERKTRLFALVTALCLVSLTLAVTTYGATQQNLALNTSGTIVTIVKSSNTNAQTSADLGLKVYSDSACTTPLSAISWGAIPPGGTANQVIYIKNTGNAPLTLGMTTANWNPTEAAASLVLTWDKQSAVLMPGQSTQATLVLMAVSNIQGITSFGFQIILVATG
ncbi:MAG: hypothetical protein NWE96_11265 [Candidatus Bathyarchaeota archaeon]|nr:hypothetical protein [Candidatus Bathyarchaeota archaeon]